MKESAANALLQILLDLEASGKRTFGADMRRMVAAHYAVYSSARLTVGQVRAAAAHFARDASKDFPTAGQIAAKAIELFRPREAITSSPIVKVAPWTTEQIEESERDRAQWQEKIAKIGHA